MWKGLKGLAFWLRHWRSALVGVLTGVALWIIGLENAAVWGITAGVLNLVPYVGSLMTAVATALVAFLQFGTLNMASLPFRFFADVDQNRFLGGEHLTDFL